MPRPSLVDTAEIGTTRERILEAALELFASSGFAETSMRQLAKAVGFRESSLYNHFENKEAIFNALIEERGSSNSVNRLRSPKLAALSEQPRAFCSACAHEFLDQWSDVREQRFQQLIRGDSPRARSAREQYYETLFDREARTFEEYFVNFARLGRIETSDPRESARLFMAGLIVMRVEHFLSAPEPAPRRIVGRAIERFVDNFVELIKARDD